MSPQSSANILHIDDDPGSLEPFSEIMEREFHHSHTVKHPNDVSQTDLEEADLILVDYKLDSWPERDALAQPSLRPKNGLALVSTYRESIRDLSPRRPKAFAIYTSQINEIARSAHPLPHTLARAYDLDWVFEKLGANLSNRCSQVSALASSVAHVSNMISDSFAEGIEHLRTFLSLSESATWVNTALQDIISCRPPVIEMATITGGTSVLRWLAHKILPYPTFLLDEFHLAARLGISSESLHESIQRNSVLAGRLASVQYIGALSEFLGSRWWRAGVEDLIWELTSERIGNRQALQNSIVALDSHVVLLSPQQHFVVLGDGLKFEPQFATTEDIVEIIPDDWPQFAGPAWARKSTIDSTGGLTFLLKEPFYTGEPDL